MWGGVDYGKSNPSNTPEPSAISSLTPALSSLDCHEFPPQLISILDFSFFLSFFGKNSKYTQNYRHDLDLLFKCFSSTHRRDPGLFPVLCFYHRHHRRCFTTTSTTTTTATITTTTTTSSAVIMKTSFRDRQLSVTET